ncbi:Protein kinase domain-containing protein [Saccharopolyspora kobensis]|uniref:non-specific serine/threonine protein kinase n=1 Tax=Saccharopolyspora kobensis TaxID=146035 RepID=A0A1H6BX13_9PSEU|nr:Protein kinase domain-containing protein [Saccharopolyspora kobensis]SFC19384.1 Protein kinase domain-containing protein [Saccharopolyspora kobensis]
MVEQVGSGAQTRLIGGRYQVIQELGRGGMGIVWRAWDQVIGREVAIKELHLPDGVPPAERQVYEERVLREARTAGRLNDPAVVTVHDVLAEAGTTYIVMELVQAVTLNQYVAQHGPLRPEQAADLARQVVSALESAHAAGIVHRDVKPSNIMVADGRVKLADFGIAQTLDDPRLTTSGAIIGSPSFMAPERLQGADASPASDLWSLGATLFFAVEGWMPFERQTTAATLNAVLNEPPQLSRPHGVVGSVITGLLINDPRARFTGPQVRALLDSVPANGAPESTRPGTRVASVSQSKGRLRPWLIASGVTALVLFAAGLLVGRFALVGNSDPIAMEPTLTYGKGGDIEMISLDDEKCGVGKIAAQAQLTEGVSCSEPHDFELVTESTPFSSSDDDLRYPGEEALARYGEGYCSIYFDSDKILAPGKQTALRFVALIPSEQTWTDLADSSASSSSGPSPADQSVYCAVFSANGDKLQTSVTR